MKTVKLTKNLLKKAPSDILIALGAVDSGKKQAFPSHVYFSKEDYAQLRKNTLKLFQKEYPGIRVKRLKTSVEMELLNYGPNELLADAIRPGYALIDEEGIAGESKSNE